ncbi:hypothetical protein ASZ90_001554 [hydrocarbon metagenome]|uniref:Uncharacterized protein n=1 Tax=hydrocarbon metagenome TaxID=938273 RepID=A0A0W8G694_9ZZZZ
MIENWPLRPRITPPPPGGKRRVRAGHDRPNQKIRQYF